MRAIAVLAVASLVFPLAGCVKRQVMGGKALRLPMQPGETVTNPADGAVLVPVPPDGSGEKKNSGPGFWIYRNEVTVAQYRKFCEKTGCRMPEEPPWGWKDDEPVVNVNGRDAFNYARWAGVRLPTESEWQSAARGGPDAGFPWESEWDASKCANHLTSPGKPAPVGSFPGGRSPAGCDDMAGNVAEWVLMDDPTGKPPSSRFDRKAVFLVKGGSWINESADRFKVDDRPDYAWGSRALDRGFRCAVPAYQAAK